MTVTLTVAGAPVPFEKRVGARFSLRTGQPLTIGPSRDARLATGPGPGPNAQISLNGGFATVQPGGRDLYMSLNGVRLVGPERLDDGDTVYVEPGWALRVNSVGPQGPLDALESQLSLDDDQGWPVYLDRLLEQGLHLGQWLLAPTPGTRQRAMGLLAELHARGTLMVTWHARGLLSSVRVLPEAWHRPPGLAWSWAAIKAEPTARFLQEAAAPIARGQPSAELDQELAQTLAVIAELPAVSLLRRLRLGSLQRSGPLPNAEEAFERLRGKAPQLAMPWSEVVPVGPGGRLVLESCPDGLTVAHCDVNAERPLLGGRSLIGSHPKASVRVLGAGVAELLCTVTESAGQWVVAAGADALSSTYAPIRVNDVATTNWHLLPGDVVEPLPGLRLRFGIARQ
jgi:hypothetical protein